MTDDPRVRTLLERILETKTTPEEVCRDSPDLLPEVRERWVQMRAVQAEIEALFPDSDQPEGPTPPMHRTGAALPSIPGYEVESVLGRGGMGIVYQARQLRLGRRVAIKMLIAGPYAAPRELARFSREAELVARLHHPNIVQVHDVGELEGRPYFTMELVDGGNLAQQIARAPRSVADSVALLAVLADAVHAAHQSGVVHRDLKPANILLTAGGTPKITDFGLARLLDGESLATASGAKVGTPCYMAPEQALGDPQASGAAADVYSLGAILYELLAGRPPFQGETASETLQQVITADPKPLSRWVARVPRDLETICLKCLRKEPSRRYATAAALAEDLRRFERGEPIAARAAGVVERVVLWARRRPALACMLVGLVLLGGTLLGGGVWLLAEDAALARAAAADLDELARALHASAWVDANSALQRAKARLCGGRGPSGLQVRLDQGSRDLRLVARLDAIRLERALVVDGSSSPQRGNRQRADQKYESVFRDAGLGEVGGNAAVWTARLRASDVRAAQIAALDDWCFCARTVDPGRHAWLLEVARNADPDPTGWRDRVRDPETWWDSAALSRLTKEPLPAEQSVPLLVALGERLLDTGGDAVAFFQRLHRERPGDFWINLNLGMAWMRAKNPRMAVRYLHSAVALRPDAVTAGVHLGTVLSQCGELDEAFDCYQRAIRLAPDFAPAYVGLGNVLLLRGQGVEAADLFQQALRLEPGLSVAHVNLAKVLLADGHVDEAIGHLREALAIERDAVAHNNLGCALRTKGRIEEAIGEYRKALALDPEFDGAYHNLGLTFAHLGRFAAAIESFQGALRIAPEKVETLSALGSTLAKAGRLDEADERFEQALRLDPKHVAALHGLGLGLAQRRAFAAASDRFEQALRLDPKNLPARGALGAALRMQGRFAEARAALREYLSAAAADTPEARACVEQLRVCEQMLALEARVPAILDGSAEPADAAECVQAARLCANHGDHAGAVRLFARAFAQGPKLAEDLKDGARYEAATAAARAGQREQARRWLRDDLALWARKLEDGSASGRRLLRQRLTHWQQDPHLASLRERDGLAQLAAAEREQCLALWGEVDALLDRWREDK